MSNFILTSIVASVILTLALNLLPMLFPNAAAKAERKMVEKMQEMHTDRIDPTTPKVKVFFPWKTMLLASVVLTVVVNLVGVIAR